jgi:hypothetical protein
MWVVEGVEVVSCFICFVFYSISSICNEDCIKDILQGDTESVWEGQIIYQYTYINVSSM